MRRLNSAAEYEEFLRHRRDRIGRLTGLLSGRPRHTRTWHALWAERRFLQEELTRIWTKRAEEETRKVQRALMGG